MVDHLHLLAILTDPLAGNLFGQQSQQAGGGLFGLGASQQQQQQLPQPNRSLFGTSNQPTTNFGISQPQQRLQQQQQQSLPTDGSLLNSQNYQNPQHILGQSQTPNRTSLWAPGQSIANPNRTIPEQIAKITSKWTARSAASDLTYYFYNFVGDEKALFYRPGPTEDEKSWDDALSRKPGPGYIPILAIGFQDLGSRVIAQQRQLAMYRVRLHEIDDKLTALLRRHNTDVSTRAAAARARHDALAQRCLALATRVQLLRNRGYALEPAEEQLKRRMGALAAAVEDPAGRARSDDVWGRLLMVRERMQMLREDMGFRVEEAKVPRMDGGTVAKVQKVSSF